MKNVVRTMIALSTVANPAVSASDKWPEIQTDWPFVSEVAREKLAKPPFNFEENTLDDLGNVESMFWDVDDYHGCPFDDQYKCDGRSFVIVSRGYVFSAQKLVDDLNAEARSHTYGGCSYLNVGSDLQSVSENTVQWGGNWNGADRTCTDMPWGSTWSHTNASAEGWWKLRILLREFESEDADPPIFCFEPEQESRITDQEGLFGLYDPETFLGGFIDTILFRTDISPGELIGDLFGRDTGYETIQKFKKRIRNEVAIVHKAMIVTQARTEKQFKSILKEQDIFEDEYEYWLEKTKFTQETPGSFSLAISERFFLDNTYGLADLAYGNANNMRDVIEGFSQQPIAHVVENGDSLWRLSEKYYSDGIYYHLLIFANNLSDKAIILKPGDRIIVPPLIDFSEPLAEGRIVLPGDTIWEKFTERFDSRQWDISSLIAPTLSETIDDVYALQIVNWPSHLVDIKEGIDREPNAALDSANLCQRKLNGG